MADGLRSSFSLMDSRTTEPFETVLGLIPFQGEAIELELRLVKEMIQKNRER